MLLVIEAQQAHWISQCHRRARLVECHAPAKVVVEKSEPVSAPTC
jgi:hypothetical protein